MKRMLSVSETAVLSREGVIKTAVKRYLGNNYSEYVDDAIQDILCKALEKFSSYSSKMGSIESWLYTIAKNYCYDLMEKRSINLKWRVQLDDVYGLLDARDFCDEFCTERKLLRKALEQMQSKDRTILTLRFYFGYSGCEIARVMDLPEKHVAVHMQRAKDRLRRIIVANTAFKDLLNNK